MVGLAQHKDLSKSKVVPIDKTYSIAIEVKFKGADPEKFVSELVDVLGPALGVSSGDILGGLVSGFTEMLYRMSWRVGKVFVFPLTDWQECEGGWVGTFHDRRTRVAITTPRPGGIETFSDDLMDTSEWSFVGTSKDRPAEVEATWSANFKQSTRDATDAGGMHIVDERKSAGSGRGKCTWQIYDANDRLVSAPGDSTGGTFPVTATAFLDTHGPTGNTRQDFPARVENRLPAGFTCGKKCAATPKNLDYFSDPINDVGPDGSTYNASWEFFKCTDTR